MWGVGAGVEGVTRQHQNFHKKPNFLNSDYAFTSVEMENAQNNTKYNFLILTMLAQKQGFIVNINRCQRCVSVMVMGNVSGHSFNHLSHVFSNFCKAVMCVFLTILLCFYLIL